MSKFTKSMCASLLKLYGALFLISYSLSAVGDEFESPVFILDNTASNSEWGLVASLQILNKEECDKKLDFIAKESLCNLSDIRATTIEDSEIKVAEIQTIQNNNFGVLTNMIGFDNSESVISNIPESDLIKIFPPVVADSTDEDNGQLFELSKYRQAADAISNMSPSTASPGTYGTISFQDFVVNSHHSTPMYGIVRVKVPVQSVDGVYTLCGLNDCTDNNDVVVCGPGEGAKRMRNRMRMCGQEFNNSSQILVYGSLFMDFVNVKTGQAIGLQDLPTDLTSIYFTIEIPININPASSNDDAISDSAARVMDDDHLELIRDLSGNNTCSEGDYCSEEITDSIPFDNIPQWSKERYQYKADKELTSELFSGLSKDKQFNLLMPSGYERGWKTAFDEFAITATQWTNWGFGAPIKTGSFTLEQIRSDRFEDIPAFIYSGGVLNIRGDTNISGLLYSPNSLEIMQAGNPTRQYINGAIIVRDSFYINFFAQKGITILSNNPDTYAKIELNKTSPKYGIFKRFKSRIHPKVAEDIRNGEDIASIWGEEVADSVQDFYAEKSNSFNNPGPQWTEIKPQ